MASRWTKEEALRELHKLQEETQALSDEEPFSAGHTKWLLRALSVLEEVFGGNSRYYLSLARLPWRYQGSLLLDPVIDWEGYLDPGAAIARKHQEVYRRSLETARGILGGASDHLERRDLESVYKGKDTTAEASAITRIISLAQRKLRKQLKTSPDKEEQVQGAYQGLLDGADIPYEREKVHISYSTKTFKPDFTVDKIGVAIEIKLVKGPGDETRVIEEMNADIPAYQSKYPNVIFIVYDAGGNIRDVEGFKVSFEENQNVVVEVVKH